MIKQEILKDTEKALKLLKYSVFKKKIKILIPPKKEMGDYSINVAFLISAQKKCNPNKIAEEIAYKLSQFGNYKKIEVLNGYINIFLKSNILEKGILNILKEKEKFGNNNLGKSIKTQIEFISANPTGPLTIGNSRGGIIGDVLANVLSKSGYNIEREYYFNDAGGQIDVLGHSILGDDKSTYKGEYILRLREKNKLKNYRKVGEWGAKLIIKDIKKTTEKMGINFDNWFAEGKDLRDKKKIEEIIKWLKTKKLVYKKDGAAWFKSKKFGDDKDRVLIKKNNEPTYFCVDCAYHKNKFIDRKFGYVINVWGADHHGDMARLKGFVKALGYEKNFKILIHQFVRIIKNGKEIRMSKRKGNYILVEDLLDQVGKDVYRFFMLEYSKDSHLDFDLQLAKEKSQKNPVYYIQYAYARIYGILDKIKKQDLQKGFLLKFNNYAEIELAKKILEFPEIVQNIATSYEVQKLSIYSFELARAFHYFYEKCSITKSDNITKYSRLMLLKATQIVLKETLNLIGVSAPKKM